MITKGKNPDGQSWRYYQNIENYLTGDEQLIITPEWGRRVIHIIDLAYQSAEAGTSLKANSNMLSR